MGIDSIATLMMIIFSSGAVFSKDLKSAVIFLSLFSMFLGLRYFLLHAPDVAITEIALGAGLTSLLYLVAIKKTSDK